MLVHGRCQDLSDFRKFLLGGQMRRGYDRVVSDPSPSQVTQILGEVQAGQPQAAERLLPLVYEQLRAIARRNMQQERAAHTLEATALVHEAYLRLVGDQPVGWDSRGHFYVAAAEAMRRILIEHARSRGRVKRGGERKRVPLTVVDLAADDDSDQIMAVDEAFRRLEQEDPDAAKVVRLRFYAGLSVEDTAAALGISPRTVAREWTYARAWLHGVLAEQ
jgi:RNA polymerase sigma factor (TIGR02999 family)